MWCKNRHTCDTWQQETTFQSPEQEYNPFIRCKIFLRHLFYFVNVLSRIQCKALCDVWVTVQHLWFHVRLMCRTRMLAGVWCGSLTIPVFNVSALLHDLITKQEIMEQQRSIIRMVQDLQADNVREMTDAKSKTFSDWRPKVINSCLKTRRAMSVMSML